MNQGQDNAVRHASYASVWEKRLGDEMPHEGARSDGPDDAAVNTRNWARLIAAMLYLVGTGFFVITWSVLATAWGQDGMSLLLSEGHTARPTMMYLLAASGISLAAAFLLLTPWSLPRPARVAMLMLAVTHILAGLVVATPSLLVSVLPFLFLLRFHREVTSPVSVSSSEEHSIEPVTA